MLLTSRSHWTKLSTLMGAAAVATFSLMAAPANADGRELTISSGFGPTSNVPDPRARQNGWLANRAGVSETLIGLDYEMNMIPRLAASFENMSETEWKITLREGALFHDGTSVTAESVKESFAKLGEEGHPGHNPRLVKLLGITEIEVVDPLTLIFRTESPNSAFLWSLTEPSAAVLKEGTDDMPIIGTGPFVFDFAETEKTYQVTGFANYWGGAPKLDRLVIDVINDPSVAALALQAGDVDLVTHYPEPEFAKLKEEGGAQLFSAPTGRLFFIQVNMSDGPLANATLREAVSLALDRDTIVEASLVGVGGQVAQGIFPANMKSWTNNDLTLPYDPAKAMAILDEAGIVDSDGNGVRELDGEDVVLKMRSYEGRAALRPSLEISQVMLSQIGLNVEIAMGEWGANNDALKAGEIDMHLQAWATAPQGDPDYFPSTLTATGGSYNVGGYSNPDLDALIEKGRSLFATEERQPIYAEVQAILNKDLPLIPLFHKTQVSVGNGKIEGYRIHPAETYLATPDLTVAE